MQTVAHVSMSGTSLNIFIDLFIGLLEFTAQL